MPFCFVWRPQPPDGDTRSPSEERRKWEPSTHPPESGRRSTQTQHITSLAGGGANAPATGVSLHVCTCKMYSRGIFMISPGSYIHTESKARPSTCQSIFSPCRSRIPARCEGSLQSEVRSKATSLPLSPPLQHLPPTLLTPPPSTSPVCLSPH